MASEEVSDCFEELETQNDGIECDGEFVSDECVAIENAIVYLGLPAGTKLSVVLNKLVSEIKDANTRIDNRINFKTLQFFSDNASAIAGGLSVGEAYKLADGTLKAVI